MKMETCNTTLTVRMETRIPLTIFTIIGLLGSIFLLVVFTKTPILKSFSGLLLIHEQFLCFLDQLAGVLLVVNQGRRIIWLDAIIISFINIFKNVSLFLMLSINVNLYIAIFKPASFASMVTRSRGVKVIVFSWIFCCSYGFAPLMYREYYTVNCFFFNTAPIPAYSTLWLPVLYTFQVLAVLVANVAFVFVFASRSLPMSAGLTTDTRNKIRLCKFILTISIAYSLTVLLYYPAMYFENLLTDMGKGLVTLFTVYLNKVYLNMRACFYLPLYQPLRETAKKLFCRMKSPRVQSVTTI